MKEEEEEDEGRTDATSHFSQGEERALCRPLAVFQLPCHPLGDAAAQQPHQEEGKHAQRHHQQDVVLGGRRHHLHGQVREAVRRRHLRVEGDGGEVG